MEARIKNPFGELGGEGLDSFRYDRGRASVWRVGKKGSIFRSALREARVGISVGEWGYKGLYAVRYGMSAKFGAYIFLPSGTVFTGGGS